MPLWKIEPVAHTADPRWLDHTIWQTVVVRAPTAAMARVIASRLDRDRGAAAVGNESLSFQSGLIDEKLYRVSRLAPVEAADFAEERSAEPILLCVRASDRENPESSAEATRRRHAPD